MRALFYVTGAGILYGFVATLAKAVLIRIQFGQFDWLTAVCVIALIAAGAAGATSCRPPTDPVRPTW